MCGKTCKTAVKFRIIHAMIPKSLFKLHVRKHKSDHCFPISQEINLSGQLHLLKSELAINKWHGKVRACLSFSSVSLMSKEHMRHILSVQGFTSGAQNDLMTGFCTLGPFWLWLSVWVGNHKNSVMRPNMNGWYRSTILKDSMAMFWVYWSRN